MKISQIDLNDNIKDIISKEHETLNPPQEIAIKKGLLKGKNIVVSSPTASGKTLIAEMAFLKNFMKGGKSVYLVPLKALASEKFNEFKEKYESIGMKVAMSVGDFDKDDLWLSNYDLIITSNEKFDSLLRRGISWINDISLVIVDEVHMIGDSYRGPTLEIVMTRLMKECNSQILALSATIINAKEISEWLKADLVLSNYRPVKLRKGIYFEKEIKFEDENFKIRNNLSDELSVCKDTLDMEKQALVFVSTRRFAESAADKISKKIGEENEELLNISDKIKNVLDTPTDQCLKLSNSVKKGVAFHHAGLTAKQRKLVEDNFKKGIIKFIVSTPTLAFGLNLPAYRVIVRDVKRFSNYGMDYIPSLEVQQMFGRAGRPKYDNHGEAVLIAKNENDLESLKERYILGDTEKITSKLSVEPVLRTHVLALISSRLVKTRNELEEFFSRTFFAYQYGDIKSVMLKIDNVLKLLGEFKFIEIGKKSFIDEEFVPAFDLEKDIEISPTKIGKRVSELYLDPISANHMIENMGKKSSMDRILNMNHCIEMKPLLRVKNSEIDDIEGAIENYKVKSPDQWSVDYENFIMEFKTTLMFLDWINEKSENQLKNIYGIFPGDVHTKVKTLEWLFYSGYELAKLLGKGDVASNLNKDRIRIKNGIRDELLPLIQLRGIGRVRARILFNSGFKRRADVLKCPLEKLENIIGKAMAKKLKNNSSS